MRKLLLPAGAALIGAASLVTLPLMAADHRDSPQVTANEIADVDDVFAWMSPDAQNLNLVMTIGRAVPAGFQFAPGTNYVFRVTSQDSFGAPGALTTDVSCTFDQAQNASCNVGGVSVTGDASAEAGLASSNGMLRVFAGQRNDPFFFNLSGFRATANAVARAVPDLIAADAIGPEGCPALDAATSQALVTQLQSEPDGSPAVDDFANSNILALVLQVDKSLVNSGGDVLGASAFTTQ